MCDGLNFSMKLENFTGKYFLSYIPGWWCNNHLEKYDFVNGKDDIPYMTWKVIKAMFQTTNQYIILSSHIYPLVNIQKLWKITICKIGKSTIISYYTIRRICESMGIHLSDASSHGFRFCGLVHTTSFFRGPVTGWIHWCSVNPLRRWTRSPTFGKKVMP